MQSSVAVSDNEEGTGEVTQRCSPQPNPLNFTPTPLDYANKVPVSQNKAMAVCHVTSIY